MEPLLVVEMLNEYYTAIVDIIASHNGMVNKFVGDSAFALFNVPLDRPRHARDAVRAARDICMLCQTRTFGHGRSLPTRAGINTGWVLAGSMGSADRMEYTVIGDVVNIAARLEQMNKQLNSSILVGPETFSLSQSEFDFLPRGEQPIRGRAQPLEVYEIALTPDLAKREVPSR